MMGLRGIALFINVLFPASMLSIINGLRLALGYAWRALVGAELLAALIEWGLGKMVYQARYFNDATVMMVGLLVIGISGYLLDQIFLVAIERNTVEKWGLTKKKRN
jgi:NitT/TauT family transport system permease protein